MSESAAAPSLDEVKEVRDGVSIILAKIILTRSLSQFIQSSSLAAASAAAPPAKVDIGSLPVRAYLDQTVVPLLLQGMAQLVKEVRAPGWIT